MIREAIFFPGSAFTRLPVKHSPGRWLDGRMRGDAINSTADKIKVSLDIYVNYVAVFRSLKRWKTVLFSGMIDVFKIGRLEKITDEGKQH